MRHTPEERQALLDACMGSGTASEEWWKNTLLGYVEMPDSNRMHQRASRSQYVAGATS